jgi:hypothetical protein
MALQRITSRRIAQKGSVIMSEPLQITIDGKPWLTLAWGKNGLDTGEVYKALEGPDWHPDLIDALLELVDLAVTLHQGGVARGSHIFTLHTGNDDGPVFEIGWRKLP